MKAAGMLFLSRTPPSLSKDAKGEPTLTLLCVDRIANHQVEPWKLVWKGQAAVDFWRGQSAQLQPGTPLAVVTENLRVHTFGRMAEITARVVMCALVQPLNKQGAPHDHLAR